MLEAGLPLFRSLRLLQEQETKPVISNRSSPASALAIEGGNTFSEALAQHPKIFNRLYLNMIKAGELGRRARSLPQAPRRFHGKTERIKGKVKAAMFYPAAVVCRRHRRHGLDAHWSSCRASRKSSPALGNGRPLPAFTRFVLGISEAIKNHFLVTVMAVRRLLCHCSSLAIRTKAGRRLFDLFKLQMPVFGPVFRKVAIARFTRTFGTLSTSGVPILQALDHHQGSHRQCHRRAIRRPRAR